MRPQSIQRARRAAAAAGALVLLAGISDSIASGSGPPPRANVERRLRRPHAQPHVQALLLHANVLLGQDVAFVGVASPGGGNRTVAVQEREGSRWVAVARARTNPHGRFVERFWPRRLGRLVLRLRAAGVAARETILTGDLATVYHEVIASWYGPGGVTACGETLDATTLGVANRTLPCGTLVTLRFRDRTIRVPVVDRGPYVPGRDYDLTYATRLALGAGDVSEIWASA